MTPEPAQNEPLDPDGIAGPEGDPGADPLAALLGGGDGGGVDFGALMEQAGQMQAQLAAAQEQASATVVEGVAGGGAVKVAVTGALEFQSVTLAPEAVDPDDVEMLQDLILAALRDAVEQIGALSAGGLDLGGMDLGDIDLGGLLGGA